MATLEDFHVGERVAHITAGDGIVAHASKAGVHVHYDNGARGIYDADWFAAHPQYLFHRSDPAPLGSGQEE